MASKELSGVFTDAQKWIDVCSLLASSDCSVQQLRVYHNTPDQLRDTCKALQHNTSIRTFEVGVSAGEGNQALAELLKGSCSILELTSQGFPIEDEVAVFASGLSGNVSVQRLTLHGLTAQGVFLIASALANGALAGKLQQLQLPGCKLDTAAAAALRNALLANPGLEILSLQRAVFDSTSSSSGSIASAAGSHDSSSLQANASNQSSNSSSSMVNSDATAMQQFFTADLAAHPSLARLELQTVRGLAASAEALQQLGQYLAAAHSLQEVYLQEVQLGEAGAVQLAAAMKQQAMQALQAVSVAPAAPGALGHKAQTSNDALQQELASDVAQGPRLRLLDVSCNAVGLAGAAAFGHAVGCCFKQLAVLNISENELGSEGVTGLCKGLTDGCCQLTELNLSGNRIKGVDGLSLFLASTAGQHLTTLSLSNNCIGDDAIQQLAAALCNSNSSRLATLNLSQNWIGDVGAKALAGMLQQHQSLACLHLQKNRIRRPGIDALSDAALANQVVLELCLDSNRAVDQMSKMMIQDLTRALAQRRQNPSSSRRSSVSAATAVTAAVHSNATCGSIVASEATEKAAAAANISGGQLGTGEGNSSYEGAACSSRDHRDNSSDNSSCSQTKAAVAADDVCEQEEIGSRASKIARIDYASLVRTTAATIQEAAVAAATAAMQLENDWCNGGKGGNSAAAVSPFSNSTSSCAVAPTQVLQVPLGFVDRLKGHNSLRSYSFEYWCKVRPSVVDTTGNGSSKASTGNSSSGQAPAVVPADQGFESLSAAASGFLSDADSLSGWLLDDAFAAQVTAGLEFAPEIALDIIRSSSSSTSRQNSLVSLAGSSNLATRKTLLREAVLKSGPKKKCQSASGSFKAPASGPFVLLGGVGNSASMDGASQSSSRYVSCSSGSESGLNAVSDSDMSESESSSSRMGSLRPAARCSVKKLSSGHVVPYVKCSSEPGGRGLSRFARSARNAAEEVVVLHGSGETESLL